MFEKHIVEINNIYSSKALRYRYLFGERSFKWFLTIVLIVFIIGNILLVMATRYGNSEHLYWAFTFFAIYLGSLFGASKFMDRKVKKEYEELFPRRKNTNSKYTREIALYYIKDYICKKEKITLIELKSISKSFYEKSKQTSYQSIKMLGLFAIIIIPFWNSFVDVIVKEVKTLDQLILVSKVIGIVSVTMIVGYFLYNKFEKEVLDILNQRSKDYYNLAVMLDENFIIPRQAEKEDYEENLLSTLSRINNTLERLFEEKERKEK